MQPLAGILVVELARYLPGAYAGRELLRLGARVVRVEAPEGDPMRRAHRRGTRRSARARSRSSATCETDAALRARSLRGRPTSCSEGFGPGSPRGSASARTTSRRPSCTARSRASARRAAHAGRAGHDLNYLGWAGVLEDTAPAHPPVQIADLAAGSLGAVTQILAALLQRSSTGTGGHVVVSMTHRSLDLVDAPPRRRPGAATC